MYEHPIPIDYEPEEPIKLTKAGVEFAPLIKMANAGVVSAADSALIRRCAKNIETSRISVDPIPLGDHEDESFTTLRIMREKYAKHADNVLQKASGGDRVDDLIKKAVYGLRAGKNIILPAECRIAFARVPALQALVASGRICFDYNG
jgi:hypothetical protein